jgi:hypothetical protein
VSHDVPAKVARRLEWTDATEWFVESATPAPDTVAWAPPLTRDGPWTRVVWSVVLLVERLYPINEYGHRISHTTFMDARARYAAVINGHDFQSPADWQFKPRDAAPPGWQPKHNGEEPQ